MDKKADKAQKFFERLKGALLLGFYGIDGDAHFAGNFLVTFVVEVKQVKDLAGTRRQVLQ